MPHVKSKKPTPHEISPKAGRRIIESRPVPANIYRPKKSILPRADGQASDVVPGPASIAELARALMNNVDNIFEWVYNNVDFLPTYGLQKGSLGALVDNCGSNFDQCELLVQLLTQAGYTAYYELGQITMNTAQLSAWLGTDPTNFFSSYDLFSYGGYPLSWSFDGSDYWIVLSYMWVKCTIDGTDYLFDPSYKTWSTTTGIDLATATGYVQSTYISNAEEGATVTADYIQNANRTNIRADLKTYSDNLISWIKTNNPIATVDDILGGRNIIPLSGPERNTTLPYEVEGDVPTEYTAADGIPDSYKATLQVTYGSIDVTFYSSDISTQRLTIFPSGSDYVLSLNGTVVGTSATSDDSVYLAVTHPYSSTFANTEATFGLFPDQDMFLIAQAWGPTGRSLINLHRSALDVNSFGGGSPTSEPILGEDLAVLWSTYTAEFARAGDLLGRMSQCWIVSHHDYGVTGYVVTDLNTYANFTLLHEVIALGIYSTSDEYGCATALSTHSFGLEQLVVQQSSTSPAVCAATFIDSAVQAGQVIYGLTSSNYETYEPDMTFCSDEEAQINDYITSSTVVVPQNAPITVNGLTGYGFEAFNTTGGATGQIGFTGYGGIGPWESTKRDDDPCDEEDGGPIGPFTGRYKQQTTDVNAASGLLSFPFGLRFDRYYNSKLQLQASKLGVGLGWTSTYDVAASGLSDGLQGMGEDTAIAGAAAIAEMYISLDLLSDTSLPINKLVIASLGCSWWIDLLTNNCVSVVTGGGSELFVLLPDGSYCPPIRGVNTLVLVDGAYIRTTPQQVVLNFNTSGQASTIVYPQGVTITFNYTSGILTSVTNGLGRTLTFSYTGTNLTSVSDGSRTVRYAYDLTGNLIQFTDADSNVTTYSYISAGLLSQVFLPAHPTVAVLTNTYDTLNRIETQQDALGNQWTYYLSGSRAEIVDPQSNSAVYYYNRYACVLRAINALGFETDYEYDEANRMTKVTLPEGNYFEYEWGSNNNLLMVTAVPKPGSGLSDITNVFTYDSTWNKVHTFQDANGNVTTLNWDPFQSTLLSIVRPMVDGSTPEITCTYNTRGQVVTVTDETGIVTQFNYSGTNEELLSVVADYGTETHLNITTQLGYTAWGDVNSFTDPNGNTTTATVDVLDRVTQIVAPSPFSFITNFAYDANSNLTSAERQTGDALNPWQIVGVSYTLNDQLQTLTDPLSNHLNLAYDTSDRLHTVTDALSHTDTYAYDALNRFYTETDPTDTIDDTRTYTDNGLLATFTDVRGNTTQFTYDGFDRLNEVIYPDTTFEQNSSYDANGNVLTYVTRSGNSIVLTYDVLNRLSTKAPTSQPTVTFAYDLAGRRIEASKPVVSGDPSTGAFQFFYDTAGRFYKEEYPDGKTFTHVLDANGNITKTTWPDGYYVARTYDQLNRLTDTFLNGASSSAAHYDYDDLSRRTSVTLGNGVVTSYVYDLDNDLTALEHSFVGSSVTFSAEYNNVNQLTGWTASDGSYIWHPEATGTVSYGTANSINQYPTVGGASYSYDGNQNLSSDGTWTFTYDTENHLLSASMTGTSASFVYDPLQRQAQKIVGSTETRYLYAGWVRFADYDGVAGTLQNRYVYGTGMDEPIIIVSGGGTVSYLHADSVGSIIAQTNGSGAVTNQATYSPFGETSGTAGTTFGFTGQRYDSETGLFYYKYRYYSPTLGRFLQTDPIGYAGGRNIYAYVDNDPLNSSDPYGLDGDAGGGDAGGGDVGSAIASAAAAAGVPFAQMSVTNPGLPSLTVTDPGGDNAGPNPFVGIPMTPQPIDDPNNQPLTAQCEESGGGGGLLIAQATKGGIGGPGTHPSHYLEGVASFYGPPVFKKGNALWAYPSLKPGTKRFDPQKQNAAVDQTQYQHPKRIYFHPFMVKVTNLDYFGPLFLNGLAPPSIIVEVNDVGNLAKYGRVLDLSPAAFDAVGGRRKNGLINHITVDKISN